MNEIIICLVVLFCSRFRLALLFITSSTFRPRRFDTNVSVYRVIQTPVRAIGLWSRIGRYLIIGTVERLRGREKKIKNTRNRIIVCPHAAAEILYIYIYIRIESINIAALVQIPRVIFSVYYIEERRYS